MSKTIDTSPLTKPPKPLSPRQQAILAFVVAYKEAEQGTTPTLRQIMRATGITSTSITAYNLTRLEARGYIEWIRGKRLDIRIPGAKWVAPEMEAV